LNTAKQIAVPFYGPSFLDMGFGDKIMGYSQQCRFSKIHYFKTACSDDVHAINYVKEIDHHEPAGSVD